MYLPALLVTKICPGYNVLPHRGPPFTLRAVGCVALHNSQGQMLIIFQVREDGHAIPGGYPDEESVCRRSPTQPCISRSPLDVPKTRYSSSKWVARTLTA